jgi:hypothetical protein
MDDAINPSAPPSGTGCLECATEGSWWLHLRRCAACGHIGCCDSSPRQHALKHFEETGHRFVQSFEAGETWWWDYVGERDVVGPPLISPTAHPANQSVPGPAERVPADWEAQLRE